ncbi:hypothetical protein [Clostridium sp.]|uniref:hypothetical protein n=1 Tax=Clostridium sp. TaxID=1506 RepID=UPI003D6D20BB
MWSNHNIISKKYSLNSRQSKDAIEQARQTLISQEKLLELRITEYEGKVGAILKKFDKGVKKEKRQGLISKLDKRLRKLCTYLDYKRSNTLPKVIFGGKDNFYKRCKDLISKEEYQIRRNNQFASRGYCHQFGMDVHNGAAMVIARRSYRFKGKVPKLYGNLFKPIPTIKKGKLIYENINYSNEWSNWSNVSKRMKMILQKDCYPRFFIGNRKNIKDMILA